MDLQYTVVRGEDGVIVEGFGFYNIVVIVDKYDIQVNLLLSC